MPETSTIKEFVIALRTGESKTTKALSAYLRRPAQLSERLAELGQRGAINALPRWARADLSALGLGSKELRHINEWPRDQKEEVRKAVVRALHSKRSVRFRWGLCDGRTEETEIRDPGKGAITVTFRSPQKRVRLSTAASTFGHVMVDVPKRRR